MIDVNRASSAGVSSSFHESLGRGPRLMVRLRLQRYTQVARAHDYARTGTLAVRSSLPQLTHAPLIARRIAFQMQ